jgi:hypothetical protein
VTLVQPERPLCLSLRQRLDLALSSGTAQSSGSLSGRRGFVLGELSEPHPGVVKCSEVT